MLPYPDVVDVHERCRHEMLDIRLCAKHGNPMVIVPGFEKVKLDGHEIGEYLTARRLFGDDDDQIVAIKFFEGWVVRHVCYLFRDREIKERFECMERERRANRSGSGRDDPEKRIENAIVVALRRRGHAVRQQVRVDSGIVDIVDDTAGALIECKANVGSAYLFQAVSQLQRYRRDFPDHRQFLGLPDDVDEATATGLLAVGIGVITPETAALDISDGAYLMSAWTAASPQAREEFLRRAAEPPATTAKKRAEAAEKLAQLFADHIPGEHWDALKANLYAAGAKDIAREFERLIGVSVFDTTRSGRAA